MSRFNASVWQPQVRTRRRYGTNPYQALQPRQVNISHDDDSAPSVDYGGFPMAQGLTYPQMQSERDRNVRLQNMGTMPRGPSPQSDFGGTPMTQRARAANYYDAADQFNSGAVRAPNMEGVAATRLQDPGTALTRRADMLMAPTTGSQTYGADRRLYPQMVAANVGLIDAEAEATKAAGMYPGQAMKDSAAREREYQQRIRFLEGQSGLTQRNEADNTSLEKRNAATIAGAGERNQFTQGEVTKRTGMRAAGSPHTVRLSIFRELMKFDPDTEERPDAREAWQQAGEIAEMESGGGNAPASAAPNADVSGPGGKSQTYQPTNPVAQSATVGQVISKNGKRYRIVALSPDGNHEVEEVQ